MPNTKIRIDGTELSIPENKLNNREYVNQAYALAQEGKRSLLSVKAPPTGTATERFGKGLWEGTKGIGQGILDMATSPVTGVWNDAKNLSTILHNDPNQMAELQNQGREQIRQLPGISDYNRIKSGDWAGEAGNLVPQIIAMLAGSPKVRAAGSGFREGFRGAPSPPSPPGAGVSGILKSTVGNPVRMIGSAAGEYFGNKLGGWPGGILGASVGFGLPEMGGALKAGVKGAVKGVKNEPRLTGLSADNRPIQGPENFIGPQDKPIHGPENLIGPPNPYFPPVPPQTAGDIPMAGARNFAPTSEMNRMATEAPIDFNPNINPNWGEKFPLNAEFAGGSPYDTHFGAKYGPEYFKQPGAARYNPNQLAPPNPLDRVFNMPGEVASPPAYNPNPFMGDAEHYPMEYGAYGGGTPVTPTSPPVYRPPMVMPKELPAASYIGDPIQMPGGIKGLLPPVSPPPNVRGFLESGGGLTRTGGAVPLEGLTADRVGPRVSNPNTPTAPTAPTAPIESPVSQPPIEAPIEAPVSETPAVPNTPESPISAAVEKPKFVDEATIQKHADSLGVEPSIVSDHYKANGYQIVPSMEDLLAKSLEIAKAAKEAAKNAPKKITVNPPSTSGVKVRRRARN